MEDESDGPKPTKGLRCYRNPAETEKVLTKAVNCVNYCSSAIKSLTLEPL